MDLVINHTSDEHPWFIESKNPDSPYRDYYYWVDKKDVLKKYPNNWTGFFSGTVWEEYNDAFYLHLFSKKQPDLNYHNPKVLEEIKDIMHFWLQKGIAGFRCDVINIIYKNSLENGKRALVLKGLEHYHQTEKNHEILKELRRDVLDKYDAFTVGETVLVDTKMAKDLCDKDRKELDMVFGFEHMESDQINNKWFKTKFKPKKWMKIITRWQYELEWNANYFENHDQPRSVSRFGNDTKYPKESAKMLSTILLTLKGTPFIYEGEEIGMTNGDFEILDDFKDVETHRIHALARKLHFPKKTTWRMLKKTSRDNARTPMQWTKTGGFSTATPWLKMNKNTRNINVEENLSDPDSVLNYYKDLIKVRESSNALLNGSFNEISHKKNVYIFERKDDNERYITIASLTHKHKRIYVPTKCQIIKSNYPYIDKVLYKSRLRLRPYEVLLLKEIK